MDACLARQSKNKTREVKRLQIAVQISLRVAVGRGFGTRRVKGEYPENIQTVVRGL